jgi:hypothetical protein
MCLVAVMPATQRSKVAHPGRTTHPGWGDVVGVGALPICGGPRPTGAPGEDAVLISQIEPLDHAVGHLVPGTRFVLVEVDHRFHDHPSPRSFEPTLQRVGGH